MKSIWRECKSKNRYRDEHTVNSYKKLYERRRGKKLDYYWCKYCKGFHLTSSVFIVEEVDVDEESVRMVV